MIFNGVFAKRVLFLVSVIYCGVVRCIDANNLDANDTKLILKPILDIFQNRFEILKNEELQVSLINVRPVIIINFSFSTIIFLFFRIYMDL